MVAMVGVAEVIVEVVVDDVGGAAGGDGPAPSLEAMLPALPDHATKCKTGAKSLTL